MAAEIFDDFNRADGAVGTSSSGHTWISPTGTTLVIESNVVTASAAAQGIGVIDAGTPDVYASVKLTNSDPGGLILRNPTSDRGWFLRTNGGGVLDFRTWDGSSEADIVTTGGGVWTTGDTLTAFVSGDSITAYINGTQVLTGTSSRYNDITRHGVCAWSNTKQLDDFSMTRAGISFVGSTEDVSGTNAASYSIAPIPPGVAEGDVCFLTVSCPTPTTGAVTFSGWTQVRAFENSSAHRMSVWYRVMQSGDDSSDTFTFDQPGTAEGISWVSAAYRGVDTTSPLIAEDGTYGTNDADSSIAATSITNDDAKAWHVCAVGVSDLEANDTTIALTATGTDAFVERNDIDGSAASEITASGWYDTSMPVATGTRNATGTHDGTVDADMAVWHGLLKPQRISASAGTVSATATANSPSTALTSNAGTVSATATASSPTAALGFPAETVNVSAEAYDATVAIGALAETVTASVTTNDVTRDVDAETVGGISATAYDASVSVGGLAETVTASATVNDASNDVTANAETVTAAVTVNDATREVPAETVSVSATAYDATVSVGGLAEAVAASVSVEDGSTAITFAAETVTASVTVEDAAGSLGALAEDVSASVTAYGVTESADAESAGITATAYDAAAAIGAAAEDVSASVTVEDATNAITANAETVAVSATAYDAGTETTTTVAEPDAEHVAVTATAYDATVSIGSNAEHVAVSAAVEGPSSAQETSAGTATAAVTAEDAQGGAGALAEAVSVVAQALDAALSVTADGGTVSAAVSVYNAVALIGALAEHVAVSAEAYDALETATGGTVGPAFATVTAYDATVLIAQPAEAETVSVSATAYDATVNIGGVCIETHPIQVLVGTKPLSKRGFSVKRIREWPYPDPRRE